MVAATGVAVAGGVVEVPFEIEELKVRDEVDRDAVLGIGQFKIGEGFKDRVLDQVAAPNAPGISVFVALKEVG